MAQGVKDLMAVAQVTAEEGVQSLAWPSGLKDPVLPKLWCRSQLWLGLGPRPGNFQMQLKKKNNLHPGVRMMVTE